MAIKLWILIRLWWCECKWKHIYLLTLLFIIIIIIIVWSASRSPAERLYCRTFIGICIYKKILLMYEYKLLFKIYYSFSESYLNSSPGHIICYLVLLSAFPVTILQACLQYSMVINRAVTCTYVDLFRHLFYSLSLCPIITEAAKLCY